MEKLSVFFVCVLLMVTIGCQAEHSTNTSAGDKKLSLDTERAKASYSVGYNMGQNLANIRDEVDFETMVQGFRDGFTGEDKAQVSLEEMPQILRTFQMKINTIMQQRRKEQGEKNKAEGEAFLKENAKKQGVITTKSGLQYKVIKEGTGEVPKATDKVSVHYRGTRIDGTEFDSSYKRGKPTSFALNRVIPGWTEGVQLMKVGAKYQFFIPANLAYGKRGSRSIGPDAVLIFDIELLRIEPPAPTGKKQEPKKPQSK